MSNSLIENWTNYSMRLRKTSKPDFFKIRNLSSEFVTKLPQEAQDELYNEMNRGTLPLGSEPEMSMYMFAYGKMHYEKLLKAFEQIPNTFFENEIEIIDYGCGQAMGLIAYADYINQKGYNQKITKITLIEPSKLTIGRAILHANQIFPTVTVNAICKSLDDLVEADIQTDANTQKLHIFSNIIDVELFSITKLSDFIKQTFDGNNQFVCVSPFFGSTSSRANRLDEFMNLMATSNVYSEDLGKNDWINGWTCSIRVYLMLNIKFLKNDATSEKVKLLYLEAVNGNPDSQVSLGVCYFNGEGVENDFTLALKWFYLASKQGDATAHYNIGICKSNGYGTDIDLKEAFRWFHLAAENGDDDAQYNLGICYSYGKGVEKDFEQAVKWYGLASEKGNVKAQNNLGSCYKKGDGVEIDYYQAFKWYHLAAENGNTDAQNNLGSCYKNGDGVEIDYVQAFKWYQLAAEKGNTDAQFNLGVCYKNGVGVEKDFNQAVKWYRSAAVKGNADAQNNLGVCYENGDGIEKDLVQAIKWYKLSAEQGHPYAKKNSEDLSIKSETSKNDIYNTTYDIYSNEKLGKSYSTYSGYINIYIILIIISLLVLFISKAFDIIK